MENDNYHNEHNPCTHGCGRPFVYATTPKCNYSCGCSSEYGCAMPACIRNKQPDCLAKAVIPAITVDTMDGLTNLANCFVHVTSVNTTFYVDDKHRLMMVWAGPIELDNYDIVVNEKNFRSQTLYTTINNVFTEVYFDKGGVAHIIGQEA